MKKSYYFSIFLNSIFMCVLLLHTTATLAKGYVLVTGNLINKTHYNWYCDLGMVYADTGFSQGIDVNIPQENGPNRGRFVIPVLVGKAYRIAIATMCVPEPYIEICTFSVKADNPHHATMKFIGNNDASPISCSYTGNPNSDTASITVYENGKGHQS